MKNQAPFSALAEVLERVKDTRSKKEKVRLLAEYLSGLGPDDAMVAARISSGRASERGSKDEAQVGYSTLLEVVKEITGAGRERVSASYLRQGDLGEVAQELLTEKEAQTLFLEPLTLADVESAFAVLRSTKGKGSSSVRKSVVTSLLLRATPLEGKYIVKVLTAEMRIGLVSGLLEEAIAAAFSVSKQDAARAHMLLGDVGVFAREAAMGEVGNVRMKPFRPVNFMLAEPMASPTDVAAHFENKAYAEYKYDGIRAQAHRHDGEVRLYSRRLEDITDSFPEVCSALSGEGEDFILDGEIVPFSGDRPLPFQLLQRRLRRQEGFDQAARNAPVVFFAFDILYLGTDETVDLPFSDRKALLERTVKGRLVRIAESVEVGDEKGIQEIFRKSRNLGYEGLVVKNPESGYTMGKRGSGWVKLKEELDTVDAVIVGAEYGHGKRAGVISDYTFAVREGESLKTIGKAYSGLSDAEIEEMTRRLKEITIHDYGYRRTVKPEIVVEVAFDSIQKSSRHDSGYALRFPRIKRIRTDKSPAQIDTLGRVREIFGMQKLKLEEPPS